MIKITIDFLFAMAGLLIALPFLLLVILLIVLIDHQNPLFFQIRLGKNKSPFRIIKLRTMKNGQITKLGAFLRRTGMDEIPQLINILCLQMSFVGPRPITEQDTFRWGWNDDFHFLRWQLRPGITGLAQLSPICNKRMSWFLDKKYVQCQTIFLDFRILFSSFAVIFVGKKRAISWFHSKRTVQ